MSNTDWQNGLISFDVVKCLYACCCPTCAAASARTRYDESNWLLNCLCLSPIMLRNIVREGFNIEGTWVSDTLVGLCCPTCAIVQVSLEVESRPGPGTRFSGGSQWSTSLTEVGSDCTGLLMAFCCTQYALASMRTKYDESNVFFNCCCMTPPIIANTIREGYQIDGTALGDCILLSIPVLACLYVAQLTREVNKRGNPMQKALG